jgi:hypothetical protein
MPVSVTRNANRTSRALVLRRHGQRHGAPGGEFDRVADQVEQHLGEAELIAEQGADRFRRPLDAKPKPLVGRLLLDRHPHPLQDPRQLQRLLARVQLARLDAGEVEDVVDQPQQGAGGEVDLVQVPAQHWRGSGVQRQAGEADYGVQRGADLVAHIGQEVALGTVGPVGHLLGVQQFGLRLLAAPDLPMQPVVPVQDGRQDQQRHHQHLP